MQNSRKPLVAGNWKMNGNNALLSSFADHFDSVSALTCEAVLCPPAPYITIAAQKLGPSGFLVAAQNVSELGEGAHTGDVSAAMLADVGCQYTIVGHSERRTDHGESSQQVASKAKALLAQNVTPIICVGEPLDVREAGNEETYVLSQLQAVFEVLSAEELATVVIAYEPIWAIGTGKTASPQQAQAMHAYIRDALAKVSADAAKSVRLLYGGSVKADNARELFSQADIDGGLIGGASLKPEEFEAICRSTML